ncbi:hypothetical protein KY339_03265 [Candidatus Woesearchaeota archaeon]|nr:hypothetical protein [Candidatus Woesearchaeota archaeon]
MFKISLEDKTNESYKELRKKFLKEANNFYKKEVWEDPYLRGLAKVGMSLGVGSTVVAYATDVGWFFLPAFAGVLNMVHACYSKRKARKVLVKLLDKRTSDISYKELEKRVLDKDYEIPEPSDEERQEMLIKGYTLVVTNAVEKKEFTLGKYPWTGAGFGIFAYGVFDSYNGNPIPGGFTSIFGAMIYFTAALIKRKKVLKIAKRVENFLKEIGYDYFDAYIKKKDPYDFYKIHVLKEVG